VSFLILVCPVPIPIEARPAFAALLDRIESESGSRARPVEGGDRGAWLPVHDRAFANNRRSNVTVNCRGFAAMR
jgi:hypothetical protein